MSRYNRTKLLPKGLQIIQGVVAGNRTFEITSASFSNSKTTESDVMNSGSIPNSLGSVPIFGIDDYSLKEQGILGIELSFTQESTGINRDIDLQSIQIEGRQSGDNRSYPIAFTLAIEPERLTLSDPSFEFRVMVYVQVGDTDHVTVNINRDGVESRREHEHDIDEIINALNNGYITVALKDANGNQLVTHDNKQLFANKPIVEYDHFLTSNTKAAPAKVVGDNFKAIENEIHGIERNLRETLETKTAVRDVNNLAKSNADRITNSNKRIDTNQNNIATAREETARLENGIIANRRSINLVAHDGNALAIHDGREVIANTQYVLIDGELNKSNQAADAKKVGDAIRILSDVFEQAIRQLASKLSLTQSTIEDNPTIRDLKNSVQSLNKRLSTLEAKIK